jgi:hypothetical protein
MTSAYIYTTSDRTILLLNTLEIIGGIYRQILLEYVSWCSQRSELKQSYITYTDLSSEARDMWTVTVMS